VGLIQSVIESSGIPTTSVTLLREVTEKVDPPRALFADYPLGYPLGAPDDPELQRSIVEASLSLLTATDSLPRIESFSP
jgi:D-proline reductase (dithiol) PrdB